MKKSLTTLCYLETEDAYLMMHRVKKENDVNKDKWIGVGGHAEDYESPEDCLLREVYEETGLTLTQYRFRGIVTFSLLDVETQYMCLYTATGWEGELVSDCREGNLEWVPKSRINELNLWTGDKVFFDLLSKDHPFFSLKLSYQEDRLLSCTLDGKELEYLDIVDEDGIPTGAIKERKQVHADGDLHRTSHVWIARHKHGTVELLLQKRSQNKDSHPGCYDISSAGHIPAGYGFLESAARELREELGLSCNPNQLIYCGTRRIAWEETFHGSLFIDNQVTNIYLLWMDPDPNAIVPEPSEIESTCWMAQETLQNAVSQNLIPHCLAEEELDCIFTMIDETKTCFAIQKAVMEDTEALFSIQQNAYAQLENKEWYVPDDEAFFRQHIKDKGFILKAVSPEGRIAGFLIVRYPGEDPDNLFFDIQDRCNLPQGGHLFTAHMESVAVDPDFRGFHLQQRLIRHGIIAAKKDGYQYFCATVHPDNHYSRRNGDAAGFSCVCETLKYGGLKRCIYFKKI